MASELTEFTQLLHRFYSLLHAANPALLSSAGRRYTIAPPQIMRESNKRTIFANIPDICKRMRRPQDHLTQFMWAEMGTTGSVDGSGRLVIKGRFQQKQIENVLRRYIGKTACLCYKLRILIWLYSGVRHLQDMQVA